MKAVEIAVLLNMATDLIVLARKNGATVTPENLFDQIEAKEKSVAEKENLILGEQG